MINRRPVPVSVWLLQMCIPLFALAVGLVLMTLNTPAVEQARRCQTEITLSFLTFYGLTLLFGLVFSDTSDVIDMIASTIFLSAVLILLPHHRRFEAPDGFWREALLPSIAIIWAGVVMTFLHIHTAIAVCNVRARFAIPISMCVTLITIESLLRPFNLLLSLAICIYALPVIIVSLRDYAASVPPAPS